MSTSPVDLVVSQLKTRGLKVTQAKGGKYEAQCPVHEDHKSSLSISEGDDGRALVHCHALSGCTFDSIISALELQPSDLFVKTGERKVASSFPASQPKREPSSRTPKKKKPIGKVVKAYDYVDGDGKLLYQAVRYAPKGFRRRSPKTGGGWSWRVPDGIPRVLYRLPEVIDAIASGQLVFLCEGEKDADAVAATGACGTTWIGGADQWLPEYATQLTGAAVVNLGDNDEPGQVSMRCRELALTKVAKIVDCRRAVVGKDVFDHLETGHDLADLVPVETPPVKETKWRTNARTLEGVEPLDVEWIWPGRVPRGMVTVLSGPKGSGKGQIVVDVIRAVTTGSTMPFGDGTHWKRVPEGRCVYLNAEDPREYTLVPRLNAAGADLSRLIHFSSLERNDERITVTLADHFAEIEAVVREHHPVLLAIDTLRTHAGADLNSNSEMAPIMGRLALLAERYNLAVLVVHHPTKVPHARASSDVSGAGVITSTPRSVLQVGFDANKTRRAIFHSDCNVAPEAPPLGYSVSQGFQGTGPTDLTIDETRRHSPPRTGRPSKTEEAADRLESLLSGGPRLVNQVRTDMEAAGLANQFKGARRELGVSSIRLTKAESPTCAACHILTRPNQAKDDARAEFVKRLGATGG